MTKYDWLTALGTVLLLAIVVIGFWKSHRVKPAGQIDQLDHTTGFGGPEPD